MTALLIFGRVWEFRYRVEDRFPQNERSKQIQSSTMLNIILPLVFGLLQRRVVAQQATCAAGYTWVGWQRHLWSLILGNGSDADFRRCTIPWGRILVTLELNLQMFAIHVSSSIPQFQTTTSLFATGYSLDVLPTGYHYIPPTAENQNKCKCNTVFYSLVAACSACQGGEYLK